MAAFGEDEMLQWRRSYHTAPPSPEEADAMDDFKRSALLEHDCVQAELYSNCAFNFHVKVSDGPGSPVRTKIFPGTESLKQCEERAYGYWKEVINAFDKSLLRDLFSFRVTPEGDCPPCASGRQSSNCSSRQHYSCTSKSRRPHRWLYDSPSEDPQWCTISVHSWR